MIIHVGKTMESKPTMTGNGKFIAPIKNGDDWWIVYIYGIFLTNRRW